ncbi:hypothetical protein QQX98_003424 [Neonectria punicea]|uniref:Uncharacterized protein n=1 Tax=Neonectria punicea TaxID=979145 RepID=A0ABR1HE94_9HYPO
MILAASRYIDDDDTAISLVGTTEQSDDFRDWVVSKATKHLSVENVQALIIIAFDDSSMTKLSDLLSHNPTNLYLGRMTGQKQKSAEESSGTSFLWTVFAQ